MKINRLEAHDRYKFLLKDQSDAVSKGAEECLKKNPLSLAYQEKSPYVYLYGHARTHENGVDKRILWEPRLTKPKPEPNSFLFRAKSKSDNLEICWILPPVEFFSQYKHGNIIEKASDVSWSIYQYLNNREELGKPEQEDLPDNKCKDILLNIARELEQQALINKSKLKILELS